MKASFLEAFGDLISDLEVDNKKIQTILDANSLSSDCVLKGKSNSELINSLINDRSDKEADDYLEP